MPGRLAPWLPLPPLVQDLQMRQWRLGFLAALGARLPQHPPWGLALLEVLQVLEDQFAQLLAPMLGSFSLPAPEKSPTYKFRQLHRWPTASQSFGFDAPQPNRSA